MRVGHGQDRQMASEDRRKERSPASHGEKPRTKPALDNDTAISGFQPQNRRTHFQGLSRPSGLSWQPGRLTCGLSAPGPCSRARGGERSWEHLPPGAPVEQVGGITTGETPGLVVRGWEGQLLPFKLPVYYSSGDMLLGKPRELRALEVQTEV